MNSNVRKEKHEVVVVGGGPAGVCAAIASARGGSRTLLIEQYEYLGGMATGAMYQPWRGFHTFGRQLVTGIGEEIVARLQSSGGSPGHLVDPTGISLTVTPFDSEMLKRTLEEMMSEVKVELRLRSKYVRAETVGNRVDSIRINSADGDVLVGTDVVIDATGDGIVAADAGAKCVMHESNASYNFSMTDVDEKELIEFAQKHPQEFSGSSSSRQVEFVSLKGFSSLTKRWLDDSPQLARSDSFHIDGTTRKGELVVSMINFSGIDPADTAAVERTELRCRQLAFKGAKFLIDNCPGFSKSKILDTSPRIGFHSSRQILGVVHISDSDVMSGKTFADAAATCAMPGRPSMTFQIPQNAMMIPQFSNIIVTGRGILPPTALFATNNQPASMQLGETAGTVAAGIRTSAVQ